MLCGAHAERLPACRPASDTGAIPPRVAQAGTARPPAAGHFDAAAWQPPPDSEIPADSLGASIRRGLALVLHTPDSLPRVRAGTALVHQLPPAARAATWTPRRSPARTRASPSTWIAPARSSALADRVNYCFTRSLAGNRLPVDSREMEDILAYIAWLSTGVPVGRGDEAGRGRGTPRIRREAGGRHGAAAPTVFTATCAACHGLDGQGNPAIPRACRRCGARSRSASARRWRGRRRRRRSSGTTCRYGRARRSRRSRRSTSPPTSRRSRARLAGQGAGLAGGRRAHRRAVRHAGPRGVSSRRRCCRAPNPRERDRSSARRRCAAASHGEEHAMSESSDSSEPTSHGARCSPGP